jgi:CheY-like chemotaxis protein
MGVEGLRILLIEDEAMIRMMVVDMLQELGHAIVAEAGSLDQALECAHSADFDLAILDVNLNGKVISPVAEVIASRGIPFIFATGYGSAGLPEPFHDRPALPKPFAIEALAAAIDEALGLGRQ